MSSGRRSVLVLGTILAVVVALCGALALTRCNYRLYDFGMDLVLITRCA